MSFRYTPRFAFFAAWYGCAFVSFVLLEFGLFMPLFERISAQSAPPFWERQPMLYTGMVIAGSLLLYILCYLVFKRLFLRVFDRAGELTLEDDGALLAYGRHRVALKYDEIKKIKVGLELPGIRYGRRALPLSIYQIHASNKRIRLTSSEKEMRASKEFEPYSLSLAMDALMKHVEPDRVKRERLPWQKQDGI